IPFDSMVPSHYKTGMQFTSFLRIRNQCTDLNGLVNAIVLNVREMLTIGYKDSFLKRSLFSLSRRSKFWAPVIEKVLEKLIKGKISFFSSKDLDDAIQANNQLKQGAFPFLEENNTIVLE